LFRINGNFRKCGRNEGLELESKFPAVRERIEDTQLDRVSFAIWLIRWTFVRDRKLNKKAPDDAEECGWLQVAKQTRTRIQRRATRDRYATSELMKRAARRFAWTSGAELAKES
jgi:hypothetical protein